jgi:hypothetical protein
MEILTSTFMMMLWYTFGVFDLPWLMETWCQCTPFDGLEWCGLFYGVKFERESC